MRRHELGHLIGAHGHPRRPRPQRAPLRVGDVPDRGRAEPDLRGHAHRQSRARQPLRLRRLRDRVGGGPRARRRHRGEHLDVRAPAGRGGRGRRAGRGARADAAAAALPPRRGVPAPHHLRPAPDPGRPHAAHLGALSAAGERALRGPRQPHLRRVHLPDLQPGGDRHRRRRGRRALGLRLPHPVRRGAARDVPEHAHGLRPRRQRQPRLRAGLHARLLHGRPRRRR